MPNLYVILATIAISFGGGWMVKGWQEDAYKFQETEVRKAAELGAAEAISKITVTNTTIKQHFQKEYHEKPVYRDCVHTPDGLRLINSAILGDLDLKLPPAGAADGAKLRGNLGEANRSGGALP